MKLNTKLLLAGIVAVSLFFNLYAKDIAPPCFNADEAAFSYNAWSILNTGKDEYGEQLPLRLKSYGDYKLPLLTYFTVPFVGAFGLNETAARLPNTVLALLFPILIFYTVKSLFEKENIALVSTFVVSTSLGLHIVGRHLHEAYLAAFLVTCMLFCYLQILKKFRWKWTLAFLIATFLSLFAYHSGRIFAVGFILHAIWYFGLQKKTRNLTFIGVFIGVVAIFTVTDILINPARVKNLLFFNNPGYTMRVQELRQHGGNRLLYNKVMPGIKDVFVENISYYSPQYLLLNGDKNYRFGYPGMAPITIVEYFFFFVGMYFLFAKKEKHRFLIVWLIFITPLAGALSWDKSSLTRTLFLFIPFLILAGYGFMNTLDLFKKNSRNLKLYIAAVVIAQLVFLFYNWDYYINHYTKHALTIRSWQCGYKELGEYVKKNYDKYDKFYITRQHGQPYMFMLFFLNYDPAKYQKQAQLTDPDEYGFGQVEEFDKFVFSFQNPKPGDNSVIIGYPVDDFSNKEEFFPNVADVEKITYGTEEIFWIYENPKLNPAKTN